MTEPKDVTIRPEDVAAYWHGYNSAFTTDKDECVKLGLQHVAARVPDAWDENDWECAQTHNALRAAVLRGPGA